MAHNRGSVLALLAVALSTFELKLKVLIEKAREDSPDKILCLLIQPIRLGEQSY